MSNDELIKNVKIMQMIATLMLVAAALILGAGLYITFLKGKFSALTVICLPMSALAMVNINSLTALKKEKQVRGL